MTFDPALALGLIAATLGLSVLGPAGRSSPLVGHLCDTLGPGPGGSRFGDDARPGLPLSIMAVATGVPLPTAFWPPHAVLP